MKSDRVFVGKDADGNPRIISAKELASRLWGKSNWLTIQQLKEAYQIPECNWKSVEMQIAAPYRSIQREQMSPTIARIERLNRALQQHALAIPLHATEHLLTELEEILKELPVSLLKIEMTISEFVMGPVIRAQMLIGRYMKVPLFEEFAYVIDSAYFAYCRGNYASAFISILPVIEGILSRWHKLKAPTAEKLNMIDYAEWLRNTPQRQPLLTLPLFSDIWAGTCAEIIKNHLYINTQKGNFSPGFNRHAALHMFDSSNLCSIPNLMRAFLLLDLIASLYLCEQNSDPNMFSSDPEQQTHAEAYQRALEQQVRGSGTMPEERLWIHRQYKEHLVYLSKK